MVRVWRALALLGGFLVGPQHVLVKRAKWENSNRLNPFHFLFPACIGIRKGNCLSGVVQFLFLQVVLEDRGRCWFRHVAK